MFTTEETKAWGISWGEQTTWPTPKSDVWEAAALKDEEDDFNQDDFLDDEDDDEFDDEDFDDEFEDEDFDDDFEDDDDEFEDDAEETAE